MAAIIGSRLGPYEIVAPLGAGGMGEVYRARDTRLGREVAIKVLPQHLSSNPEVRARFEREAKAVSSLNHPNICVLHDVGREGDIDYLVMELVQGETLAARIAKGPLPVAEALKVGEQIADALDRAHRAGVVHRDLKPGNVMLTKSGAKLMDFGLARATALGSSGSGTVDGLTRSPTVAQPLTAEGTIVGTFQYMAPEQLEGIETDARADLWALGCVLYEMVTGKRAFAGPSQASLISAIMKDEPAPVSQVVPLSPVALDRLVQACLAKSRDDRVQTAHDVKLQLRWIAEGSASSSGAPAIGRVSRARTAWLPWVIATLAVAGAVVAMLVMRPRESPVVRAIVPQPANALFLFFGDNAGPPAISPDGKRIAFVAVDDERGARLWVRDADALAARPLAGTENATYPFWSYDGRSVAFFADKKLKRVDVATGQVFSICPCPWGRGGSWGRRNEIVYSPDFQADLFVVSATGGTPRAVTKRDTTQQTTHRWPHFLPDGRHFLYLAGNHNDLDGPENAVWVGSTDGRPGRRILPVASEAQFADGHVLYVQDSVLMARPFDAGGLRFRGDAVPTADRVQFDPTTWKANVTVSEAGVLAYQPVGGRQGSQIRLLDRQGKLLRTAGASGNLFSIDLWPGGRRIVFSQQITPNGDLFAYDFDRESTRRLNLSEDDEDLPVPSPDGRLFAFASSARTGSTARMARYVIKTLPIEGGSVPREIYRRARDVWPLDWSADGRSLMFGTGDFNLVVADSVGILDLLDPARVSWMSSLPGQVEFARFSNDGHWVAYNTVTEPQVYLERVPRPGEPAGEAPERIQVSTEGGRIPAWRADDRELYYARPDGMVIAVEMSPAMQPGRETPLFRANLRPSVRVLDVSPDGQQFLVNVLASEGSAPIVLVSGWSRGLRH